MADRAQLGSLSGYCRLGAAVLAAGVLVGCGAKGSHALVHPSETSASPAVSASSNASPGFAAAVSEWRAGARMGVPDAAWGAYLVRAASDLAGGLKTDGKASTAAGRRAYSTAIAILRKFVAMPDTGLSPTEQAESLRELRTLDAFFGTPNLYM